nr:hypothetical protein [Pelagibacterales bacterium]
VPSGIALVIRDLERREDYEDYVDLWEMYEYQIYDIEKGIMSANNISLPTDLGLDFTEPEYPKSTQDEIMFNQFMLDNNLTSHSKLLKSYNKDLTIEQAKALIKENKVENGQEQSVIQRLRQRAEVA